MRLTLSPLSIGYLIASPCAMLAPTVAHAQTAVLDPLAPLETDPLAAVMERGRALTQVRTLSDCRQAEIAGDIVVCAGESDQLLPVPELYGPVPGSTDGAAVRPEGIPCGLSLDSPCRGGVDVIRTIRGAVGIIQSLLNPDRDLGPAARIPDRYRGSNR